MESPKISIIIATFNAAETLDKCLRSVILQLNEKIELILVDGSSKDSTNEIIESYGSKIAVHISEPDKGIYDAWNKGVKLAHGQWVAFIGADDVLLPNALAHYIDVIEKTPDIDNYDYICACNEYVDMNGDVLNVIGGAPKWNIYRRRMNAAHVASLHNKKNLFDTLGGYDLSFKICADYELLLRKKDKLKYIFIPNHIARMQIGGMSFSTRAVKETFWIRKKHHSIGCVENCFLFLRDWAGFKFYCVKQLVKGRMNIKTFFYYLKR